MQVLMLEADYMTTPAVWAPGWVLVNDGSLPLSAELVGDLDLWLQAFVDDYYSNDEEWVSAASCTRWHQEGWLLFARLNAELNPHGYVVLPAFPTIEPKIVPLHRRHRFADADDHPEPDEVEGAVALAKALLLDGGEDLTVLFEALARACAAA